MEPFGIGSSQVAVEQYLGPPRRRAHLFGFVLRGYRPDRHGRRFVIGFDRGTVAGIHCRHRHETCPRSDSGEETKRFIPTSMRLAAGYSPLVVLPSPDGNGWMLMRRDLSPLVQELLFDLSLIEGDVGQPPTRIKAPLPTAPVTAKHEAGPALLHEPAGWWRSSAAS